MNRNRNRISTVALRTGVMVLKLRVAPPLVALLASGMFVLGAQAASGAWKTANGTGTSLSAAADPGKQLYVLALGDSFTAGTEPTGPQTQPPDPALYVNRSGDGYADQIVDHLNAGGSKVTLVNLACYFETTQSMLDGTGSLCTYPHGSQLDEAVRFLHAHGKRTIAVVMSLGVNDALLSCGFFDAACQATRYAQATGRLRTILTRLRDAGGDVPVATINYFDSLLGLWFTPVSGPFLAQLSVSLVALPLKAFVESAYSPFGVTVVNTQAAFQTENFADMVTLPPFGSVPVNVASICAYTYICTPFADAHANRAGNGVIAQSVELALGF
jgi:lysophospholipase L1-like esterase